MSNTKHNTQPQPKRGSPPSSVASSEASDGEGLQNDSTDIGVDIVDNDAPSVLVTEQDEQAQASRVTKKTDFETVMIIESVPSCTIGGQLYSFRAGHAAKVPADVARHLRNVRIAE